ncbi:MAG: hypothetical protein ACI3Z8_06990 [Paludibacteraceae bacterium]
MKTKLYILLAALWVAASAAQGQNNAIRIPDLTVASGNTIQMPVELENSADIVAIQFTITLPSGLYLTSSEATLTERADGHSLKVKNMTDSTYLCMVFSAENKPIIGRKGTLFTIPLYTDASVQEGDVLNIKITNLVIADSHGDNLASDYSAGAISIIKSADLEVQNVQVSAASISPNGALDIQWSVANIGGLGTTDGWSERLFLVGADGTEKCVGTLYYDGVLNAGASVSRQATLTLPAIVGIDGEAQVRVTIVPNANAGEPTWMQANNTALSAGTLTIEKQLVITPASIHIDEASYQSYRLQLTRSGSTSAVETFRLTKDADARVVLPETITIQKGQSGRYIYLQVQANQQLDTDSVVHFTITDDTQGYAAVEGVVILNDDTYPRIMVAMETEQLDEGESTTATITLERASATDLLLTIRPSSSRLSVPATVLIPAGETAATIQVTGIEDQTVNLNEEMSITVSATGYQAATQVLTLVDNDIPALQLVLAPDVVSESDGPLAVTATIRKTTNIQRAIQVLLYDDSEGEIYYGTSRIEMPAGVEEATLRLGAIDNATVDGERVHTITSAVYSSACRCNVLPSETVGVATARLTITDNDGPTLSLKANRAVINEGETLSVTLSRNTAPAAPLVVTLSADNTTAVTLPETVTIPTGETSVVFNIQAQNNTLHGDDVTIALQATAEGFSKANLWFSISDQTLPDAMASLSMEQTTLEVGDTMQLNIEISNIGSYILQQGMPIMVYASYAYSPIATIALPNDLAPTEKTTLTYAAPVPSKIGTYQVYAVANEKKEQKELSYSNNYSQVLKIDVTSPFQLSVQTEKALYQVGDSVLISGQVEGKKQANQTIEIYAINDGYRYATTVTSDESGHFQMNYQPKEWQIGTFAVGACYPSEGKREPMATISVYGMKRTSTNAITHQLVLGDVATGSIRIQNPCHVPLKGLAVKVVSKPEDCTFNIEAPSEIPAGSSVALTYQLTPTQSTEGNDWSKVELLAQTEEGVELPITVYYFCQNPRGALVASLARINTTMVKGQERVYSFILTNVGRGETGKISLELPSFMSLATPREMPSMQYADSAQVILLFTPTDDMPLNYPVTGTIGINCANGSGLSLPFSITPVSESTGTLVVDVCDENTYYTAEAPHLRGAAVRVSHPTTGKTIAEGTTDENGLFTPELQEGYYVLDVTANGHSSYRKNILVDPGTETKTVINLSIEAIRVDFQVEETEIEDEYDITTTVQYETNVPVPVVELTMPNSIPAKELGDGESLIFYAVLTNKGLITAEDVSLVLPSDFSVLQFEALSYSEPFKLAPQQSVQIPVRVTNTTNTAIVEPAQEEPITSEERKVTRSAAKAIPSIKDLPCVASVFPIYFWECGLDRQMGYYERKLQLGTCTIEDQSVTKPNTDKLGTIYPYPTTGPSYPPVPTAPTTGGNTEPQNGASSTIISMPTIEERGCIPCLTDYSIKFILCGLSLTPGLGCITSLAVCGLEASMDGMNVHTGLDCALAGIGCKYPGLGELCSKISCIHSLLQPCSITTGGLKKSSLNRAEAESYQENNGYPSYVQEFQNNAATILLSSLTAYYDYYVELFGDSVWVDNIKEEELKILLNQLSQAESTPLQAADFLAYKPTNITDAQFERFIQRLNNSNLPKEQQVGLSNCIDVDHLADCAAIILEQEDKCQAMGYSSMEEMWQAETTKLQERLDEASQAVCASISLQFSQQMVLTRQAFEGTLTVFNGHETDAMENIRLNLEVRDPMGIVATAHEFQTNLASIDQFNGELAFDAGWTLSAQQTGVAKIQFIPTKYAAPMVETPYTFGGTLTYTDPFTGLDVTRELFPVTLTVKPAPNLELTYFMQRDILGDDPLTEEVEPSEDAQFALLIHNKGYGDATNVRMTTEQPSVVDNQKGLLINMEIISTQLNGQEKTLALGKSATTEFGNISAQSTTYAQWWFRSSLLGHFTDYDVKATQVNSYGNPDLSLLDTVTIRELIHAVRVGDMLGFLTNDIIDDDDLPDMLYTTDGETESVAINTATQISRISNTEYTLLVTPSSIGWNYGSVADPTYGKAALLSVVRKSDGENIPLDNFWLTDRTLRDGKQPLYENRIHFADRFATLSAETYQLTFMPTPDTWLAVDTIIGIPENGFATSPITELIVVFNKPINSATFTTDDITISCQGEALNAQLITITPQNERTYTIDLSKLYTVAGNGYYQLTIQTTDITDMENFQGKSGKSKGWNMYREGNISLTSKVLPADGGTVVVPKNIAYGETFNMTASPNEGFLFCYWSVNDEQITDVSTCSYTALGDMKAVAVFDKKKYRVQVDTPQGGTIEGNSTGIYPYGEELRFTAHADDGFTFAGWIVDGVEQGANYLGAQASSNVLQLTVAASHTIQAQFVAIRRLTLLATPSEGGTVDGDGDYLLGSEVLVTANAATDYTFVRWSDGLTENPRTITLTEDSTLWAEFVHDAALVSITYDGVPVPDFNPAMLEYTVELPATQTDCPVIAATPYDAQSRIVLIQATVLPGQASVVVIAKTGALLTYTIKFTRKLSSDATLSALAYNGISVENFRPDHFIYEVSLPSSTTAIPTISAISSDLGARVIIVQATTFPGQASVVVISADGSNTTTYTVEFQMGLSSDASLMSMAFNGTPIEPFDAKEFSYMVTLPQGTALIPYLTAEPSDPLATVDIEQATGLPGEAHVLVTAENGTQQTYVVFFTIASTPTSLSEIENTTVVRKIFRNGQLIIIRGEQCYTPLGITYQK